MDRLFALAMLVAISAPAAAAEAAQVPEGSGMALFAIGVAGILVGRHFSSTSGSPRD